MGDYEMHCKEMEEKYGTCPKCNKKMEHLKGIHTFRCSCGYTEWYGERVGDKLGSKSGVAK